MRNQIEEILLISILGTSLRTRICLDFPIYSSDVARGPAVERVVSTAIVGGHDELR